MNTPDKVKKIISEQLCVKIEKVIDNARLKDDLGADSLDLVELVMELELKFRIEIEDEKADKVFTVRQVIELVENEIKNK